MRASLAVDKPDLIIDPEFEVHVDKMRATKSRHPWRQNVTGPRNRPITVPDFMAYCCVGAALRPYTNPCRGLFAILLVEGDDVESYMAGARLYLRHVGGEYADSWLKTTSDRRFEHTVDELLERPIDKSYAFIVVSDKHQISDKARLFSDAVVRVSKPSNKQIIAAFARFGHTLAQCDLRMIAAESWERLRLAFLPGRSVAAGLQRLRAERSSSEPDSSNAAVNGPTLHDLHGFGDAGHWGIELSRDVADYLDGKLAWSDVDHGVLVSGSPGVGKTTFAEALSRTCRLPLVSASAAQWQAAGHLGDFLKAMRQTFHEAKSKAPSILFVDEIDSFGDRSAHGHNDDYKRQIINGFLECIDGIERREGLIVIGATNFPDILDPAIRRAGRLDRHIHIPMPDAATRLKITEQYAGLSFPAEFLERLARTTEGMTGADISLLIRDARRLARRRSEILAAEHVLNCLPQLRQLAPDTLHRTAIHEAGHAIVGLVLGLGPLEAIVIRKDITAGAVESVGKTLFSGDLAERRLRSHYLNHIAVLMAGMAAEELEFGESCDGATGGMDSDLGRATSIATLVEVSFGLGSTLIVETVSDERMSDLRVRNPEVRAAINEMLKEQYERARNLLVENLDALREVATEVLKVRHLQGGAVTAIIERHRVHSARKLRDEADQRKVSAALAILDRVPDNDPDEEDEVPNDDTLPECRS